ncbi:MAG: segregation/condensation protein A [Haloferacaceae archaeon]
MTEVPDAVGAVAADALDDREADDDEVEPVELLVQLAEEGEIEPWDIDIVAVTDAFLDRLEATDLRTSGRALFYASVLLRMKSDALVAPPEPEEPEDPRPEPWEAAMGAGADDGATPPGGDPVAALSEELDRRLERRHARGSPETLDELVRELREAERGAWWKESRTYDTDGPAYARGTQTLDYRAGDDRRAGGEPTADEVTGATHAEDMEAATADVRAALAERYGAGRDEALFAEVRDAGGAPVHTYLALLFLAHRGAVRLRQDDLFGDLWIAPGPDWTAPDDVGDEGGKGDEGDGTDGAAPD